MAAVVHTKTHKHNFFLKKCLTETQKRRTIKMDTKANIPKYLLSQQIHPCGVVLL